jgi:hypothetical protein
MNSGGDGCLQTQLCVSHPVLAASEICSHNRVSEPPAERLRYSQALVAASASVLTAIVSENTPIAS